MDRGQPVLDDRGQPVLDETMITEMGAA
jgi:hypothetical protein